MSDLKIVWCNSTKYRNDDTTNIAETSFLKT